MKPAPTHEMIEALELCQKALSMMITPAQIDQTSTLQAFAIATEAEAKARAALSQPAEAVVGEPVAWTTQAQIDKFKVDPGCNAVMWGEPLPCHPDIPLYASPPSPQSTVDADAAGRKLSLWFFRDLSGEQRGKLFGLFGMNDAQRDANHGYQAMALSQVVRTIKSKSPSSDRCERLAAVLRGYEAWEADIIMNGEWDRETPHLTQEQFDEMLRLQDMRNLALKAKSPSSDRAASEGKADV